MSTQDHESGSFRYKRLVTKSLLYVTGLVLLICLCLLLFRIEEIGVWWRTVQDLPAAEAYFGQVQENTLTITQDVLLDETQVLPLQVRSTYPHCIRGEFYRGYGTQRSYQEVITEYIAAFVEIGWSYYQSSEDPAWHFFNDPTGTVEVTLSPLDQDTYPTELVQEDWDQYSTMYRVRLIYANPSYYLCFGV